MRSATLILTSLLVCCVIVHGQVDRNLVRENAQTAERRVALVIGNASYRHAPQLANPGNDARDIAAALRELGFEVLFGEDQTGDQMKRLIKQFGTKLTKGSKGLFYFAGHGIQLNGRNYLVPIEIESLREATVEFDAVDVNRVLAEMDAAGNGFNIVILDACRNNPFSRSWRDTAGGLASISAPTGTFIAYSTAPNTVASDGAGRNGLFTQELLKQLRSPLSLEEVFKRVRTEVRKRSNGRQVPWESSSVEGTFYFSGTSDKPAVTPPVKRPATEDETAGADRAGAQYIRWNSMLKRRAIGTLIDETTHAINRDPRSAVALRMRGHAYRLDSRYDLSRADASSVPGLLPRPADAVEFEARCWANSVLDRSEEALADCSRAISLDPTLDRAYATRGSLYDRKLRFDLALADFGKVIELDPKWAGAYSLRGNAYVSKKSYDMAIRDLTRSIELAPTDPSNYRARATAYDALKNRSAATADNRKADELEQRPK